jgi:hypothetical protein
MKHRYTFLPLLFCAYFQASAQLPDGIVAPDFTATDIQGNTWNLYDLLDQGKSVVLHFGATWCGDCWDYHQSGVMNELVTEYGDDIVPFFIEADDSTTPEDLNGTGGNTQGDWVTGALHPILDDAGWLGDLYVLDDVPRIYHICPSRILTNARGLQAWALYDVHTACNLPFGQFNAAMVRYEGFQGEFCGEKTFQPSVRFQNLGAETITDLQVQVSLNGSPVETRHWTGNLPLYQVAGVGFNPVTVTDNTAVEISIQSVNGQPDEAPDNDVIQVQAVTGAEVNTNFLVLELKTDDYPWETYWEIVDANGNVFHSGGNGGIFTNDYWEGAYPDANTVYRHEVTLPTNGCYEFIIYDQYDDGICCGGGLGYYRLTDVNNLVYFQGGLFTEPEHRPFELSSNTTINDNAAIKDYEGASGDFCGDFTFAPSLDVQNLGANTINSLEIKIFNGGAEIQTFTWNGAIEPSEIAAINLDPLTLNATATLDFVISQVNGQADVYDFQNERRERYFRRKTATTTLRLEFVTDEWGYENYWQMTNSAGDLIATGGNQEIGPTGGGLQTAGPNDPGSYPPFTTINEFIELPDSVNDCYEFLFVDDWGDGIFEPGYIKMIDESGDVLFDFRPLYTYDSRLIDGQFGPNGVGETDRSLAFSLYPNPVSRQLHLELPASGGTLDLKVSDAYGKLVSFEKTALTKQAIDVSKWANGVYFLTLTAGDGRQHTQRVVVVNE